MSELILRTFFTVLRMNNLTLSLRPRPSQVTLFDPPPNKVSQWRERWICIESRLGFPFLPKCKALRTWDPIKRNTPYSDSDVKFLNYVRSELGDDPRTQTKVFLSGELIADASRYLCGIGGYSIDARRRELGLEDNYEYPFWKLHPGRVFLDECPECSDLSNAGCSAEKGRYRFRIISLFTVTSVLTLILIFFYSDFPMDFSERRERERLA